MVSSEDDVCPSSEIILTLVDRTITDERRACVELHLDRCSECRMLVAQLGRGSAAGRAVDEPGHGAELARGDQVGRYLVVDRLASGGMGAVYVAYDPELDRKIALKLLRPDRRASDPDAKARLQREAQAMARLQDPNVVAVHDVGSVGELVYIAMELVDGGTLRSWLRARERTRAEILTVFGLAGKGLAAAHRGGLVHRDFKPDNVLVGDDGRVRVTDFGLARAPHDVAHAAAPDDEPFDDTLTHTGTLVGTPAYMAPEQLRGEPADARGDQFSFAVALYEALWGARPFAGRTPAELGEHIVAGIKDEPAAARRASAWLRRAVLRGVSPRPEDRWPSVDALLEALQAGVHRARRGWLAVLSMVVMTAFGLGFIAVTRSGATSASTPVCGTADGWLAGVWDASRKTEIARAFAATGRSYAAASWRQTERALDAYTAAWSAARRDACLATRVRHDQSEHVMDLRIGCLERRREPLRALSELFAHADADLVTHAADATAALAPIAECADTSALAGVVPLPDDPRVVASIARVRTLLDDALASEDAGRYRDAQLAVEALVPAARVLAYPPLLAEALVQAGHLRGFVADDAPAAEAALTEAVAVADEARDDGVRGRALGELLEVARSQGDFARAHVYAREAEGVARRRGGDPRLEAHLDIALAEVLDDEGKYADAFALGQRAVEEAALAAGVDSVLVADASYQLGSIAYHLGRLDDAERAFRRALALEEQLHGASSPDIGLPLHGLADVAFERDDFTGALDDFERELRAVSDAFGASSSGVARALVGIGRCQLALDRGDDAVRTFRRAVDTTRANQDHDSVFVADVLDDLADALLETDQVDEAAATDEAALAIYDRVAPTQPAAGQIRAVLARVRERQGRTNDALALIDAAIASARRAMGDDRNPMLPDLIAIRGEVLFAARRDHEAEASYQEAIAREEHLGGDGGDSVAVGDDLVGLGQALLADGDVDGGVRAASRGLDVLERHRAPPSELASARFTLARGLWSRTSERARAVALARDARASVAAAAHPRVKVAELDAWLATHRP